MSKFRVTHSYSYNALCDSCGMKFKASELRVRWDGLWVCKDDFEFRHPSDFYRSRNDTHKLDRIRSDTPADPESTWTSTCGITINNLGGETGAVNTGFYIVDGLRSKTRAILTLTFTKPSLSDATIQVPVGNPVSTTTSAAATYTLPTTPGSAGTATIITDTGRVIGSATVSAGNATVTLPSWTKIQGNLEISALYGT